MNSTIINICKLYFEKVKNEIFYSFLLSVITFFCLGNHLINEALQIILGIIGFVFIFKISKSITLVGNANNIDSFNWKYLLNLPLKTKEKISMLVSVQLISTLPFMLFLFINIKKATFLLDNKLEINLPLFIIDTFLIFILIYLVSLNSSIVMPRRMMQKFSPSELFIKKIYIVIKFAALLSGIIFSIYFLFELKLLDEKKFLATLKFLLSGLINWYNVIYLLSLILFQYRHTLKNLTNEIYSYENPKQYNIKRNLIKISLIVLCAISFYQYHYYDIFFNVENLNEFKNQSEIEKVIQNNKGQLNKPNSHDFTLTDSIIHSGNLKLLKEAEKYDANFNHVVIKDVAHKGFNALYLAIDGNNLELIKYIQAKGFNLNQKTNEADIFPIHVAIMECNPKVIQYFDDQKVNLNVINSKNENLFIYSLKNNCPYSALWLFQKGVDLNHKDLLGNDWKKALEKGIKRAKDKDILLLIIK